MQLNPIEGYELKSLIEGDQKLEDYVIYDGLRWKLYANADQAYLGRAYLWLKGRHVDFHPLEDLRPEEWEELQLLARTYGAVLKRIWSMDLLNYAWFGNEYEKHRGHGHMHLIPRYKTAPTWAGSTFHDLQFGDNYAPFEK